MRFGLQPNRLQTHSFALSTFAALALLLVFFVSPLDCALADTASVSGAGASGSNSRSGSDSSFRSAAKAEAFKSIASGNSAASTAGETEASDEEIALIKKAAADPSANPQRIKRSVAADASTTKPTGDASVDTPASMTADSASQPSYVSDVAAENAQAHKLERQPTSEAPAKPVVSDASAQAPSAEAQAIPAPDAAPVTASVPAAKALLWLQHGNERYVKKHYRADGKSPADRARVAAVQKPHAIVLACSDSRVPPEIVFDQGLGEIYVIRVAGEALDSSVVASIEHALKTFGPQLLVVLGHTQCDAVGAACQTKTDDSPSDDSDMGKLLADIRPRLKTVIADRRSAGLEVEAALNADGAARELVHRSETIRKLVDEKKLVIKPALYRLDSGKVAFY